MRLVFIKNPSLKEFDEIRPLVYEILKTFDICSEIPFAKYLGLKTSLAVRSGNSSERFMKTYKRWQEDFFMTLWVMLVNGSPAHTMKAINFHPMPFFCSKIWPHLGTFGLSQGKKSSLGFNAIK
jgi:hypothetical protein